MLARDTRQHETAPTSIADSDAMIWKNDNEWIDGFKQKHGRPARILHIGNIANNAYNNAKLLNALGFDCDVICYDYYHVMSCPEWEDADFEGDAVDNNFPAWEQVELNGFRRPQWFVQGPLQTCIRYLKARRKEHSLRARWLWKKLSFLRWMTCAAGCNEKSARLPILDRLLDERRLRAERDTQLLTVGELSDLKPPTVPDSCGHSYQSYVIRLRVGGQLRRNQIMDCLADEGIQTRPGTHAAHRLGYYVNKYDIQAEDFPNAATAEETTITLPIFPGMTDADQDRVVDSLRNALHQSGQAAA